MKNCIHCQGQLITCGWGYYFHPVLKDHHGRTKDGAYQCTDSGKHMKIM